MIYRNKFVFIDNYAIAKPGNFGSTKSYVIYANTLDEAWEKFAKYARFEFGMGKDKSVEEVKEYFKSSLTVVDKEGVCTVGEE